MNSKPSQDWPYEDGLTVSSSRTRLRATAIAHLTLTILLIVWNYVANTGVLGATVGEVSGNLDNIFTPASYAFAIWGIIYLGLLALGIFEVRLALRPAPEEAPIRPDERFILALGSWFSGAQVLCGLWLAAWLTGQVFLSVVCMSLLLASLLVCVFRTNMERWHAPTSVIVLLWWPLSVYCGWISVAFLANISAYLAHLGSPIVQQPCWALALAAVVVATHASIVWLRNMREFSMVGAWALVAIAVRHSETPELSIVSQAALVGSAVLVVNALAHGWRSFMLPPDLESRLARGRLGTNAQSH